MLFLFDTKFIVEALIKKEKRASLKLTDGYDSFVLW